MLKQTNVLKPNQTNNANNANQGVSAKNNFGTHPTHSHHCNTRTGPNPRGKLLQIGVHVTDSSAYIPHSFNFADRVFLHWYL